MTWTNQTVKDAGNYSGENPPKLKSNTVLITGSSRMLKNHIPLNERMWGYL